MDRADPSEGILGPNTVEIHLAEAIPVAEIVPEPHGSIGAARPPG
jgi:hypothetical protein